MELTDGMDFYKSMSLKKFQNITDQVAKNNNTVSN